MVDAVIAAITEALPSGGDIGLLGGEALAWRWGRALAACLPEHRFVEVDDLAMRLRRIKSPREIDLLRAAGRLGARAIDTAMAASEPGVSEAEIAAVAGYEVVRAGGVVYGLGLSSGPWAHTFSPSTPAPYSRRRLDTGDLVRLDLYGSLDGYLFDVGRSRVAGHDASEDQRHLLDAVRDAVRAGSDLLRPGESLAAVARRCEEVFTASSWVRRHGAPDSMMGGTWGHGVGLAFEPPWIESTSTVVIQPGMCLRR